MVPQYITSIGTLKKYSDYWNVKEINSYLKMCYEIFYEIFPNCIRIQLPEYVHGNFYHKWGANPLHYQDSAYKYFTKAIDIISGRSESASLDKLRKMQSIENRLYTRLIQNRGIVDTLKKRIENMQKIIDEQGEEIHRIKNIVENLW